MWSGSERTKTVIWTETPLSTRLYNVLKCKTDGTLQGAIDILPLCSTGLMPGIGRKTYNELCELLYDMGRLPRNIVKFERTKPGIIKPEREKSCSIYLTLSQIEYMLPHATEEIRFKLENAKAKAT